MKLAPGLDVRKSPINGKGCFATKKFPKGKKIAEYTGEKITNAEAVRRSGRRILRICAIDRRWSLDGSKGGNGTHYINHSCRPNTYMKVLYGHILFLAMKEIKPGMEITIDYQSTLHSDKKRCECGDRRCRGTINKIKRNR